VRCRGLGSERQRRLGFRVTSFRFVVESVRAGLITGVCDPARVVGVGVRVTVTAVVAV